ncbi:MAG: hypothetical protein HOH74_23540, partial [Gemmatimonadetes bacterium]|nr:hypothetical protein [Gemmatimonadota bacterium]
LILKQLTTSLRNRGDVDGRLSESEQVDIRLAWLRRSMRHGEAIIRRFLTDNGVEPVTSETGEVGPQQIVPDVDIDEVADI